MKVIGKDRKRQQIDTKTSSQPLQLMFDPFLTMIKVFAGDRIRPEQKAATDNPIHDMDNRISSGANTSIRASLATVPSDPVRQEIIGSESY